jgi:hypothetical protein
MEDSAIHKSDPIESPISIGYQEIEPFMKILAFAPPLSPVSRDNRPGQARHRVLTKPEGGKFSCVDFSF